MQHPYMCHMCYFYSIRGMLILYIYREKDREKNGDAYKNWRRDLSDTAKKEKLQVNSMERKLYWIEGATILFLREDIWILLILRQGHE